MWTISDFLAYGMLYGWHKKMSCPYCMNHTKSFTLSPDRKPCFFDCHHRFLSVDHPFRRNRDNFRKEKIKNDRPTSRLFGEEVRDRVMELSGIPVGENAASETFSGFGESYNWWEEVSYGNCPIGVRTWSTIIYTSCILRRTKVHEQRTNKNSQNKIHPFSLHDTDEAIFEANLHQKNHLHTIVWLLINGTLNSNTTVYRKTSWYGVQHVEQECSRKKKENSMYNFSKSCPIK